MVQNDRVFRLTMTGLGPLAARPIGASAKKQATCPGIGWPSSHARAQAPTGARPGQGRPREAIGRKANWRERKKTRAKVVQLVLELLVCWRNSASAKVYNFRWNWIFAGAIPRARKSTTFAGIAVSNARMVKVCSENARAPAPKPPRARWNCVPVRFDAKTRRASR